MSDAVAEVLEADAPLAAAHVAGSQAELLRLQARMGYQFDDSSLLKFALTHASGASHRLASNERMEFLGDAILGAVVCEELFHRFPKFLEGDLTKVKSVVVSRQTCARASRRLDLGEFLILGKGMSGSARLPMSLLAGAFEGLVAAIYLDGGLAPARDFILRLMAEEIAAAADGDHGGNFKSLLQQYAQREMGTTPTYRLVDAKGPDHSKCFQVAAQIGRRGFEPAWGRNKKEAEQLAAQNALAELNTAQLRAAEQALAGHDVLEPSLEVEPDAEHPGPADPRLADYADNRDDGDESGSGFGVAGNGDRRTADDPRAADDTKAAEDTNDMPVEKAPTT